MTLMLLLCLGEDRYVIGADYIVEIFPRINLKIIPHSKKYLAGLLNYGGVPLPVIDLSQIVIGKESNNAMHTRIILLQYTAPEKGRQSLGLIAEQIVQTEEIDPNTFIESGLQLGELPFLEGVLTKGNRSTQFISVPKLFEFVSKSLLE